MGCVAIVLASGAAVVAVSGVLPSLRSIARKHQTDKIDHNYVSLYAMLLDPLRHSVRNVTEVGVLEGSSMLMWAEYFPNAQVWGLDIILRARAIARAKTERRITLHTANAHDPLTPARLQLANESMDLVVEDASHGHTGTILIAEAFWRLVRPGGFYVIEDINTGGDSRGKFSGRDHDPPGFAGVVHNATGFLASLLRSNDAFFSDTLVGGDVMHSKFFKRQVNKHWSHDVVNHNNHLLVFRKSE